MSLLLSRVADAGRRDDGTKGQSQSGEGLIIARTSDYYSALLGDHAVCLKVLEENRRAVRAEVGSLGNGSGDRRQALPHSASSNGSESLARDFPCASGGVYLCTYSSFQFPTVGAQTLKKKQRADHITSRTGIQTRKTSRPSPPLIVVLLCFAHRNFPSFHPSYHSTTRNTRETKPVPPLFVPVVGRKRLPSC